jgi:hypothetical protein
MLSLLRKLAFPTAFVLASAAALLSSAHFTAPAECPQEPASPPTGAPLFAAPAPIVAAPTVATPIVPAESSDVAGVRCLAGQHCVVSRAVLAGLLESPSRLAEQARIMPSLRDGEFRGFKVYGLRPGSVPRQLGLKNGDLIKTLDGVALTSMEAGLEGVMRLRDAAAVDLDLERKGQPMRLRVAFE